MALIQQAGIILDNRYELVRHIDSGGMAHVFEAWDSLIERRVAVKILQPVYAADADFCARFLAEAKATAGLSHSNIVAIYDYGSAGSRHYMVMEYLSGGNAAQILQDSGPLRVERAITICVQVASALAEAHQSGIIHRDVKPANILFTADKCPKLTDFGVARRMNSSGTTVRGTFFGTPEYIAPEVIQNQRAGPAADVYSLGVTLYELLTGTPPFSGNIDEVLLKHLYADPLPPSQLIPDIPRALDTVVCRALAKDPADRFPDVASFAAALTDCKARPVPPDRVKSLPCAGWSLLLVAIVSVLIIIFHVFRTPSAPLAAGWQPGLSVATATAVPFHLLQPCLRKPGASPELSGSTYDTVVFCIPGEAELVDPARPDRRLCLWPGDLIAYQRRLEVWVDRYGYWYPVRVHQISPDPQRPAACASRNDEGLIDMAILVSSLRANR